MSAYIIYAFSPSRNVKIELEKVDDAGLRRYRRIYGERLLELRKSNPNKDTRLVIEQAYETHVREFSKKRQNFLDDEYWDDDPCCGCGGIGSGWVRVCPDDCWGKRWRARLSEMNRRYTPKVIW